MPRVLNKRTDVIPPDAVYCGRPSRWGNPFIIPKDGSREEVVQKHREYVMQRPYLLADIKTHLRGKDLVCWCAPLPCHCDTLLEIANKD